MAYLLLQQETSVQCMSGTALLASFPSFTRDTLILSEQFNGRPMGAIWPQAAMTTLSVSGMPKLLTPFIFYVRHPASLMPWHGRPIVAILRLVQATTLPRSGMPSLVTPCSPTGIALLPLEL